jgi:hypothetical protein
MKTKNTTLLAFVTVGIILASTCMFIVRPVHAAGTVALINTADGSNNFNFTSPPKNVGDTFLVNLTIANAVDLGTWQVAVQWNNSLINFVSMTLPADHILATKSPIVAPTLASPGLVIIGAAAGPGAGSFTGSGRMAQLTFNITHAVGEGEIVQTDLSYEGMLSDTFLLDSQSFDITGNYAFNVAHYTLSGPPAAVKAHDIAVTNIVAPLIVSQNSTVNVNVTVKNNGDISETFSVGVTANGTNIDSNQTVTSLATGASTTLTFAWNTTTFATGKYIIVAAAGPVAGETNTADNTLTGATVSVRGGGIIGDINGDGKVTMKDIALAIHAFGRFSGTPQYNPDADVNGDGRVDMRDILAIVLNFT